MYCILRSTLNQKLIIFYIMNGNVVCEICSSKYNYRDVVVDRIEHIETERERVCNNCDNVMDYWAFGHWESNSE